jgi:hypothetical protein
MTCCQRLVQAGKTRQGAQQEHMGDDHDDSEH